MSHRDKFLLTPLEKFYQTSILIVGPLISVLDVLTVWVSASLTSIFLDNGTEIEVSEIVPDSISNSNSRIWLLLALFLSRSLLRACRIRIEANYRRAVSERVTQQIFTAQISSQSRDRPTRDSAELLRDLEAVPRFLNCYLFSRFIIFEETLLVVGIVLVITFQSTVGGLAVLWFGVLLLYVIVKASSKKIEKVGSDAVAHRSRRIQFSQFIFRSIKEITLYGKEKSAVQFFSVYLRGSARAEQRFDLVSKNSALAIEVTVVTSAILTLWLTSVVMDDSAGALSDSIVIAISAFRIIPSVSRLTNAFQERKFEKSQADILFASLSSSFALKASKNKIDIKSQTFDEMQLINKQANDSKNVTIELQNLKFAYSQEQSLVITKLNHIFDAGLLHVVRGDSGRGKSTLLSLIMGAEEAQDGQVLFNQVPLKSSLIFKDHQIAYVPQSVAALDYSLSDNITLAFGENETIDENRLWYAITTAGLAELVESLPNGVRTRVGELGSRVSGGELQRIGLARALYREPRVLLLDEATSNLDYETEHKILTNLASFKDQLLIIIVSHSDHVAQFADKILEL